MVARGAIHRDRFKYSCARCFRFLLFLKLLYCTGCSSTSTVSDIHFKHIEQEIAQWLDSTKFSVRVVHTHDEQMGPPIVWRDILEINDLGSVVVAPDGRRVGFIRLRADDVCDCYASTIYLHDLDSGVTKVVAEVGQPFSAVMAGGRTNGELMLSDLQWSQDGHHLAFVANKEGKPVLNVYDVALGAAREVQPDGDPVYGYVFAPDSEDIIYQTGYARREAAQRFQRELDTGFLYDDRYEDVWQGQALPLLPEIPVPRIGDGTLFGSRYAATSIVKRVSIGGIVTQSEPNDLCLFEHRGSSTYGLDSDVVLKRLRRGDKAKVSIEDGRRIVLSTSDGALELPCGQVCDSAILNLFWLEAKDLFVAARVQRGRLILTKFNLHRASKDVEEEIVIEFAYPANHYSDVSPLCDAASDSLICVIEESNAPPFLAKIDVTTGAIESLFDPNQALRSRHYSRIDRLLVKSSHGTWAYANLHYPANYQQGRRYPLVIVQYNSGGFARGGTGNENPILAYAEAGLFVLVRSNVTSGIKTSGTGLEKAIARYRAGLPTNKMAIDSVVDYLFEAGLIDKERVGYTGLSAGANIIDYALANGANPGAVITSTCCSSPDLAFLNPFGLWNGDWERLGMGNPLRDPNYRDSHQSTSPGLNVDRIDGAILVNVSEFEAHGFKPLLAWMRELGKPMEVYTYSGEYHIKTKPRHRAAIYRRNIDWLQFWLQGIENANPVDPEQYTRWRAMRDERCAPGELETPSYCPVN